MTAKIIPLPGKYEDVREMLLDLAAREEICGFAAVVAYRDGDARKISVVHIHMDRADLAFSGAALTQRALAEAMYEESDGGAAG